MERASGARIRSARPPSRRSRSSAATPARRARSASPAAAGGSSRSPPASRPRVSAISSVTVSPHMRPWHGPMPQRRNDLIWLGPVQPSAHVVDHLLRRHFLAAAHDRVARRACGTYRPDDTARRETPARHRTCASVLPARRSHPAPCPPRRSSARTARDACKPAALDRGLGARRCRRRRRRWRCPRCRCRRRYRAPARSTAAASSQRCSTPAAMARLTFGTTP